MKTRTDLTAWNTTIKLQIPENAAASCGGLMNAIIIFLRLFFFSQSVVVNRLF